MTWLDAPAHGPGRWVRRGTRIYLGSDSMRGCRWCGRIGVPDCRTVECLACGSIQCQGGRDCIVCLRGLTWPGKTCRYAGCKRPAVARAPRVGLACAECLPRAKTTIYVDYKTVKIPLLHAIAEALASRGRTHVWVEDPATEPNDEYGRYHY